MDREIVLIVLGAGAVGLSTAIQLQSAFPNAKVTVVAASFGVETTSDGAAGLFRPTLAKTPGVPYSKLIKWLKDSWNHYDALAHSPEASEAGVQVISSYQMYDNKEENILEKEILYNYRPLTNQELHMFPGKKYRVSMYYTDDRMSKIPSLPDEKVLKDIGPEKVFLLGYNILSNVRNYLYKELPFNRFKSHGGNLIKKNVNSLEEFVGKCDILVNCAGMGNKILLNDNKLKAIKGQLLRVHAPWIKNTMMVGDKESTYIYPGMDNVVVGGTREEVDELDASPREEDTDDIMRRACEVVPSLKKAKILWKWVGFRPHREPLRLEPELLTFKSGSLQVVHNYGHGAEGVSLSWGTAINAVDLVKEIIGLCKGTKVSSKL